MSYAIHRMMVLATLGQIHAEMHEHMQRLLDDRRDELEQIALKFVLGEVSPTTTFEFETQVAAQLRELGRQWMERVLNLLEPAEPQVISPQVQFEAGGYRRLNHKTRNGHVATLFGTIELWRYPYRYWHRGMPERCLFPLEMQLGLLQGATPALADAVGRYMAQAGATQQSVLDRLRSQHHVSWGAERLRDLTRDLAQGFEGLTEEFQVRRILELLQKAEHSRGKCRPVLSVGRDGVTLREYRYRFFEHASVGTVAVYDRAGNRLGTVYLAFAPQLGQAQMTARLTALLRAILERWQGPLPRLTYVTDAGENETQYYRTVLRSMRHPRTGEKLHWYRIIDYYHAAERIWTMAAALFGPENPRGRSWALRMCRLLKKSSGPSRVLHSAAALRKRRKLSKSRAADYRKAYNYIRCRTKFMQYHQYKRWNLPLGSGVTEAACKTVVAQRLKLSGMRWGKPGSQMILNLRVVLLSGIWQPLYQGFLETREPVQLRTYGLLPQTVMCQAA
jgi:hypothetical protein